MSATVTHSPSLLLIPAILLAGAFGALARTLINDAIVQRVASDFPYGILIINLIGSFVLGLLTGMAMYHGLSADALIVTGTGICGGFTTWSTSIWESLQLLRLRLFRQSVLYTVGGLALGVGVAAAGLGLAALA
jgi:CrcB protein